MHVGSISFSSIYSFRVVIYPALKPNALNLEGQGIKGKVIFILGSCPPKIQHIIAKE